MERSPGAELNLSVSGLYLNKNALDVGFNEHDGQRSPVPARITGNTAELDRLLQRSGWRREPTGSDPRLHHLLAAMD